MNRFGYTYQNPLYWVDEMGLFSGFPKTLGHGMGGFSPGYEYTHFVQQIENTLTPSCEQLCVAQFLVGSAATSVVGTGVGKSVATGMSSKLITSTQGGALIAGQHVASNGYSIIGFIDLGKFLQICQEKNIVMNKYLFFMWLILITTSISMLMLIGNNILTGNGFFIAKYMFVLLFFSLFSLVFLVAFMKSKSDSLSSDDENE